MTNKYVKKVIPVEAVQWNGDNVEEIRSLYTRRYRGSRKATGFRAPNNMIQKGTNLIVYGRANTIINTIRLSDYVVVENGFFKIVSKNRFETEYEQQDNSVLFTKTEGHSQKPSNFSLCDLVMQIAPQHIKYYIDRLKEYGFYVCAIYARGIIEMMERDQRVSICIYFVDKQCFRFGFYENSGYYYVDNNNWREAFNKLVASFPDSIMKNTNR